MGERDNAAGREDLRRSEERFRLLVESVVDYAIFMLDPDGHVETWNIGAERLKGYRPDEIIGRHYSIFYPDESRRERLPDRLLAQAREQGRATHSGWRVRKDGTRFWADVVITALFEDGSDDLAGFAKVTRDMTETYHSAQAREQALREQERALQHLQEIDRWRTKFTQALVHDLQTPVIAIAGFSQLLLDDMGDQPSDPTVREMLQNVRSNARSLQQLVDNLRHADLGEHGVGLMREPIALRPWVDGLLADMAPVFGDRPVSVDVEDVELPADPRGLERVLRNLLGNAARHTPPGTAVHVRAEGARDGVRFEVEDEGEGIQADLMPRIFEPFEQGDEGGPGLGLSIAKQYVELHGGTISAHRSRQGGTSFRFLIPYSSEAGSAADAD